MEPTLAKYCYFIKQHFASTPEYHGAMEKLSARQILAFNLKRMMDSNTALDTQQKLGKASGLGQTTISYMQNPPAHDAKKTSVKLDSVEKVAHAFGMQAWQMLIHPDLVGEQFYGLLMGAAASSKPRVGQPAANDPAPVAKQKAARRRKKIKPKGKT